MRYVIIALLLLATQVQAQLEITQWQTPEGAKVLFTQTKGLPILDIQLNFDAASSRDGDKHGVASLTNALLGTATNYKNEEQIINAFESVGAQFSSSSLKDMAIVSLRTLTRQPILKQALDTLTEVVTQPVFKQSYLTREKRQTLRAITAAKQSVSSVATLAFDEAVFGDHPYAHPKIGTQAKVDKISLSDINQHYQTYYVAKNLTIALVGDISQVEAKQIARQISHGLNIGVRASANEKVLPLNQSHSIHIEFPSKQTHLLIGQTGVNRSHPDYYALYLGNHIFGGSGLTSILSNEIREKRGLAYSAYSYFTKMRSNGFFMMRMQTKNAQASKAKDIALNTLKKFVKNPIDAQKLQDGKDNIIGGFALETASNANILTYLSIMGFYDLPLNYLSSFTDKIKDISANDIQKAYQRLIDTEKLIVLTVGAKK